MATLQSPIFDSCNLLADYSQVTSDPILPYLVTLNLTNSRLTPAAGENQRFCYDVTSVGAAGDDYADLTQLVLGLCDEITPEQIAGITVTINGEEQEVEFGPDGNVAWRTADDTDPVSGCTGLAFYFPLEREDSQMQVCFELTETYPIGPVPVCLSGGDTTASSLDICGPVCEQPEAPVTVYYQANVCAPFRVTPYAVAGEADVTPCGEPEIILGDDCGGGGECGFTVRQQLCIAVPVSFGAAVEAREATTECLGAGGEEVCDGCGEDGSPEEDIITRKGCGN